MTRPVYVLGINAYHGDASAAIVRDGVLLAAVAEERLRRTKHWAGFPALAIRAVLHEAGIGGGDVAHVAVARDPLAHLVRKGAFVLARRPALSLVAGRLRHARAVGKIESVLGLALGLSRSHRPRVWRVEHHRAHLASAFFASPFAAAACCAVDGFGDFVSTSTGMGRGGAIDIETRVHFPHSLGVLYTAVAQYLGFPGYGDEFKVMALAAYGGSALLPAARRLVTLGAGGAFALDLEYFRHWSEGAAMEWAGGYPTLEPLYAPALESLFGPRRAPGAPITQRHKDIAAAVQAVFEETLFHVLRALWQRTGDPHLCLAGGCALNAVANGQIRRRTPFRELFVPPAAGDDGTAVGAALEVWHRGLGGSRREAMQHAAYGPGHTGAGDILALGDGDGDGDGDGAGEGEGGLSAAGYAAEQVPSADAAAGMVAEIIASGGIVAWYEGRSEWGARALGQRSLVADPRCVSVRDRINRVVKGREAFRPLAPSVLWEAFGDYFEGTPDPFMTQVATVRAERRQLIPAVTHVDGTARVHAVRREASPAFYRLIERCAERTGVPLLLNTSLNENEPIVDTPAQALACVLRTGIDALVIDRLVIRRVAEPSGGAECGVQRPLSAV